MVSIVLVYKSTNVVSPDMTGLTVRRDQADRTRASQYTYRIGLLLVSSFVLKMSLNTILFDPITVRQGVPVTTSNAIVLPIGPIAIHPLNREEPFPSRTRVGPRESWIRREHAKGLGFSAVRVTGTGLIEQDVDAW